jgi:hypothetical protein
VSFLALSICPAKLLAIPHRPNLVTDRPFLFAALITTLSSRSSGRTSVIASLPICPIGAAWTSI